jgi:type IV secretion system protein VirB6
MENIGNGVGAALTAVDCASTQITASAFNNLFAQGGALEAVLTILLTLYVAFFSISLMLGRSNLSIRALLPRIIMVGLVLAFATSWVAFRSVVWNLFIVAPDYLATLLAGSNGSATLAFAGKLDVVFLAVQEASSGQEDFSAFSPAGLMWLGATMLLLGTVGVLVTARIALALLVALGPIFVVLALFSGTRGLFTGWLKAVVMLAITPLIAVLGGSLMLELSVPIISSLVEFPGQINAQAAMAFFLLGAVHIALMVMAFKVSSTMVAGWRIFGLAPSQEVANEARTVATPRQAEMRVQALQSQASGARRIDVSSVATTSPANDTGPTAPRARQVGNQNNVSRPGEGGTEKATPSRTYGIGNRFRSPNPRALSRLTEAKS